MAVEARFWVQKVEKVVSGSAAPGQTAQLSVKVTLAPVIRKTEDNIQWSRYTASGTIELWLTQQAAIDWYEQRLGQDVAITFDDVARAS